MGITRRWGEAMRSGRVTILQVNDTHGYLEPHPELMWNVQEAQYRTLGSYAVKAGRCRDIREECGKAVLLLDNGDTFHGTYPVVQSKGAAIVPLLDELCCYTRTGTRILPDPAQPCVPLRNQACRPARNSRPWVGAARGRRSAKPLLAVGRSAQVRPSREAVWAAPGTVVRDIRRYIGASPRQSTITNPDDPQSQRLKGGY